MKLRSAGFGYTVQMNFPRFHFDAQRTNDRERVIYPEQCSLLARKLRLRHMLGEYSSQFVCQCFPKVQRSLCLITLVNVLRPHAVPESVVKFPIGSKMLVNSDGRRHALGFQDQAFTQSTFALE